MGSGHPSHHGNPFWRVQHANLYELIDDDWWPYPNMGNLSSFIQALALAMPQYATHHYGHKENLWAYGVGTIFSQWPLRTDGIWEPHIVFFFCMARHCTYLHNCRTPSLQHSYGFGMQKWCKMYKRKVDHLELPTHLLHSGWSLTGESFDAFKPACGSAWVVTLVAPSGHSSCSRCGLPLSFCGCVAWTSNSRSLERITARISYSNPQKTYT